jgi:hypothetical protein
MTGSCSLNKWRQLQFTIDIGIVVLSDAKPFLFVATDVISPIIFIVLLPFCI